MKKSMTPVFTCVKGFCQGMPLKADKNHLAKIIPFKYKEKSIIKIKLREKTSFCLLRGRE